MLANMVLFYPLYDLQQMFLFKFFETGEVVKPFEQAVRRWPVVYAVDWAWTPFILYAKYSFVPSCF